MIRTLTEHDGLALERVGYERGTVLRPGTGRPDAHQYRVDVANPLVVDGLVLLEEDGGGYPVPGHQPRPAHGAGPAPVPGPGEGGRREVR